LMRARINLSNSVAEQSYELQASASV
jgi:hypothetical protein